MYYVPRMGTTEYLWILPDTVIFSNRHPHSRNANAIIKTMLDHSLDYSITIYENLSLSLLLPLLPLHLSSHIAAVRNAVQVPKYRLPCCSGDET